MNYSASFVLPMLNIPYVYKFLVNTYCGDINFTEGELGEYFFVHLNKKIDIIHNQLVCSYEEDNSFVYVFKVTEEQRSTILNKFMNGEYSKIDRDYVKNSFQLESEIEKVHKKYNVIKETMNVTVTFIVKDIETKSQEVPATAKFYTEDEYFPEAEEVCIEPEDVAEEAAELPTEVSETDEEEEYLDERDSRHFDY